MLDDIASGPNQPALYRLWRALVAERAKHDMRYRNATTDEPTAYALSVLNEYITALEEVGAANPFAGSIQGGLAQTADLQMPSGTAEPLAHIRR